MGLRPAKTPAARWNYENMVEFSGESESLSDYFFGFSDGALESLESSSGSSNGYDDYLEEEEEESGNAEEKKAFWDSQEQLLQATLCRTSSTESKIRQATKQCLRQSKLATFECKCRENVTGEYCRICLRREVCNGLLQNGFNSAICKSKWRSSHEIPAGEHTYLEVVDKSNPKRGAVRVIVELNFRAEFEMARASGEYNQLISRLPEVFVGKDERLRAAIKILCRAAKRCMKERNIHMGPWRKQKYMLAKWLGNCQSSAPAPPETLPAEVSSRLPKPRASMLTFDLSGSLPDMRYTAVEVL
ncbi:uncharacterized protein LOC116194093 [Punica granatum]|uniref:Uncharacterized protein n=2 Tax=Punica granatum TaxID=22663 RepID=A0A218X0X5_PUNGR|nr:uncharacterized protein LOC116194093 [Punica granatum]OWM78657.1 hypothetical protein CDL15_Pgr002828 [Punica granatum]PKI42706.1 hypothetical protein CRG98_036834 [Punica granatum]